MTGHKQAVALQRKETGTHPRTGTQYVLLHKGTGEYEQGVHECHHRHGGGPGVSMLEVGQHHHQDSLEYEKGAGEDLKKRENLVNG